MAENRWFYHFFISVGGTILIDVILPKIITDYFSTTPLWLIILTTFGIFSLIFGISGLVGGIFTKKPKIEFYENRHELIKQYGSFLQQVQKSEQLWICAWVGQSVLRDDILEKCKVTNLILLDPEYSELEIYANQDSRNLVLYQDTIIELSKKALENKVPVYWIKEPVLGILIYNPNVNGRNAWARVEDFLPYGLPSNSPSYMIHEKEYPDLFKRVCETYSKIIDKNRDKLVTQDKIIEAEKNMRSNTKTKSLIGNEFHLEFNDNSMTTKDGRIFLGITFFSPTEIVVDNLYLELNDKRFQPLEWMQFDFKYIHSKNYIFDLVKVKQVVKKDEPQNGRFVVLISNAEYYSPSFNIAALL